MQEGLTAGSAFALDLHEQPTALARVLPANADRLTEARQLVATSHTVRLLAVGSSRHVAGIGAAALELAGVRADVPPAPGAAVPPPVLGRGDLVVAVSQSGETPSVVQAVRRAREHGCAVVSVTNAGGTLAQLADVALDCAAGPERVVAASKSVTTAAVLLRALAGAVDLAPLVESVGQVLAADVRGLVAHGYPGHVVAGGLGAEWVAAEVALKLAETGGPLVTSEPVVEHLHGPVAVPARTLALVEPDDPNAGALGGAVLRIGTDPSYALVLPLLRDAACAAVLRLVAGQVLALELAWAAGVDADAPRGLSKVTRTR